MVTATVRKIKELFLHKILHADDTPHRIALGAAAGMFVAMTPTAGIQMILAVALAALLRANKAAAIPMVWVTNPLTNIPIYAFGYSFGNFLLTGSWNISPEMKKRIADFSAQTMGRDFFHMPYWSNLMDLLMKVGIDLWVGCLVMGIVLGLATYPVVYWLVVKYRKFRIIHAAHHKTLLIAPVKNEDEPEKKTKHNAA